MFSINRKQFSSRLFFALALGLFVSALSVFAMPHPARAQGTLSNTYSSEELVNAGSRFFGSVSQGLASIVEKSVSQFGQPNAYILGQEGSAALIGGVRYGEGTMYTRNAGRRDIFWQGPTVGFDAGADGSRVMMLVYNLPTVNDVYGRYPAVQGTAYFIGGVGMTVMKRDNVIMVPIRAGVGARLGINVGYLKFTPKATWNPF